MVQTLSLLTNVLGVKSEKFWSIRNDIILISSFIRTNSIKTGPVQDERITRILTI